jgi:hypothetical protein
MEDITMNYEDFILLGVPVSQLPNGLHFSYNEGTKNLLQKFNPDPLGVMEFFDPYGGAIVNLDIAFEYSPKSPETDRIVKLDEIFDDTFSGMKNYVYAYLKHRGDTERYAAENLKVIFDKYGNIAKESYREALTYSHTLLQELKNHPAEIKVLLLTPWMDAHEKAAKEMRDLMEKRNEDMAHQTHIKVREARKEVDYYYHKIVNRINAMINLHTKDYVPGFYDEFNQHATEYNNKYAQHLGRLREEKKKR